MGKIHFARFLKFFDFWGRQGGPNIFFGRRWRLGGLGDRVGNRGFGVGFSGIFFGCGFALYDFCAARAVGRGACVGAFGGVWVWGKFISRVF